MGWTEGLLTCPLPLPPAPCPPPCPAYLPSGFNPQSPPGKWSTGPNPHFFPSHCSNIAGLAPDSSVAPVTPLLPKTLPSPAPFQSPHDLFLDQTQTHWGTNHPDLGGGGGAVMLHCLSCLAQLSIGLMSWDKEATTAWEARHLLPHICPESH